MDVRIHTNTTDATCASEDRKHSDNLTNGTIPRYCLLPTTFLETFFLRYAITCIHKMPSQQRPTSVAQRYLKSFRSQYKGNTNSPNCLTVFPTQLIVQKK